jgi:hypothetical protein
MYRSNCHLRIGTRRIHGLWQPAPWSKAQSIGATAEFRADEPAENAHSLSKAIDAVLRAVLPKRHFTSPYVRVSLAGCHVMAAILSFVTLPKSAADRSLLISQRFCREHRLQPSAVTVIGCQLGNSKAKEEKILCLAVERGILDEIESALAGRGLHSDCISPDYLLRFEELNSYDLQKPGIALLDEDDSSTILVWDKQGIIVHIAGAGSTPPARQRAGARIRRYAQIVAAGDIPATIYIDGRIANDIVADLRRSVHGLSIFQLPVEASAATHGRDWLP